MNHSFSILFWTVINRTSKKTGEAPINARITVDGKRSELSTGKKILPEKWNVASGRMRGSSEEARTFNRHLSKIQMKLEKIFEQLSDEDQFISAQTIRNIYQGKNVKQHQLLELFRYHVEQIRAQLGKGYALGTLNRYKTTFQHTQEFIKWHFNKEDIYLKELKYSFITEFEVFLKSQKNIGHNTTMRYLKSFKRIVLIAVKNDWLPKDPFSGYKMTMKEVNKGYLTKEELKVIYNLEFSMERLEHVRDIFLFCCYTGLSYADVKKLTSDNVSIGMDGEYWIFINRTKTGSSSNVPLLPIAQEIMEKYKDHPITLNSGYVLPVISNQKMNAYLKELATLSGIKKNITFHMARHTFATSVTLANGVAIETVGSMLGHKNLKTTQIYAKVVQEKVSQDMKALKGLLSAQQDDAVNQ